MYTYIHNTYIHYILRCIIIETYHKSQALILRLRIPFSADRSILKTNLNVIIEISMYWEFLKQSFTGEQFDKLTYDSC